MIKNDSKRNVKVYPVNNSNKLVVCIGSSSDEESTPNSENSSETDNRTDDLDDSYNDLLEKPDQIDEFKREKSKTYSLIFTNIDYKMIF